MSIERIIQCLDAHMIKNRLKALNPVEAGEVLDREGLLKDSETRPGLPLRRILRAGKIPHAVQPGGKGSGWVIPLSGAKGIDSFETNFTKPAQSKSTKSFAIKARTKPSGNHEKELMDSSKQKSVGVIDNMVPPMSGMYCIRIRDVKTLPQPFSDELSRRGHDIVYIGIASKSLRRRMLGQELRARGHGTFFRSMGALLGYTPPPGSLIGKSNQRNYRFSEADNARIIEWMNAHLTVHWVTMESGWDQLETALITKHRPLVNLAKNRSALPELSMLRKKCVDIALSLQ